MVKRKYPLQSTEKELKSSLKIANKKLDVSLTKKHKKELENIQENFRKGNDSLKKHSKKDGSLKVYRLKLHNKIINKQFKNSDTIDKKDPDLYILGGIAGSGKSEVLRKRIPEKVVSIDNDDYKKLLAKTDKSPIEKYVLAHAALLHEEADLLTKLATKKALKESRDTLLDMTFATFDKGKALIDRFKAKGYDVHFLGTQKKPHHSIPHVVSRFLKKGRYVPPEVVAAKGNRINKNVIKARKLADSHIIADTTTKGKPKIIYASPKLVNKPIQVKRHKRKSLKNKTFVRKHRRRKSRFSLNYRNPK